MTSTARLGLILVALIGVGLAIVYLWLDPLAQECNVARSADPRVVCTRHAELALVLTLVFASIATLFGTLSLEGAQDANGTFRESRIRFSIAVSVLVLYLVYFGMAVFWDGASTDRELVGTLTNLLMVVVPFYFGASAATQIAQTRSDPTGAGRTGG